MRFAFKSHAAHILITAFLCHPFPDNTLGEPCGLNLHSRNTHKKATARAHILCGARNAPRKQRLRQLLNYSQHFAISRCHALRRMCVSRNTSRAYTMLRAYDDIYIYKVHASAMHDDVVGGRGSIGMLAYISTARAVPLNCHAR